MRLEHVCDMDLAYQEVPGIGGKVHLIRPYGTEEGSGYGEGDGTVAGPRMEGRLRWVNHPHRRSDGVFLPNAHGLIRTDDGATILFSFQGRTFSEGGKGKQLLVVTFEAEDERYRWLNRSLCVLEGLVDGQRLAMRSRVYACHHEFDQLE
jgi:hypothetical protein